MTEVRIIRDMDGVSPTHLTGFFEGWKNVPPPEALHQALVHAAYRSVAIEVASGRVIGFTYAVSDRTLSAYIPLLEVLPNWRAKGHGRRLVEDLLKQVEKLYMVDVCCDEDVAKFYSRFGFDQGIGMSRRNYECRY